MTKLSRYSYTTSWAVGRRFRSHRRIALMSRRCAGANLAINVRTWASADRRAGADWVLPGTSTSTWMERRPEASFFTLMMSMSIVVANRRCIDRGSVLFFAHGQDEGGAAARRRAVERAGGDFVVAGFVGLVADARV